MVCKTTLEKVKTQNRFNKIDFTECKFFKNQNLSNKTFIKCNFTYVSFNNSLLVNAEFTNSNLTKARLVNSNLAGANLTNVNLSEAILADANLTGANFTGANLTNSNLEWANLTGANFTGANLTGANLNRANLTGAIITAAQLQKVQPEQLLRHEAKTKGLLDNIKPIIPHNIDKKHIKEIKNTFSNNVFDMSMFMEIPKTEIDDEEDNVILYIDKQPMGFLYPREQLKNAYNEYASIFMACNKLSLSAVPIRMAKTDNVYIRINLTMNFFIKLKDMMELFSSKHKEWLIKDTGVSQEFTTSIFNIYDTHSVAKSGYFAQSDGELGIYAYNIMNTRLNIVSSDHCQNGTTQRINSLTPIKFTPDMSRVAVPDMSHVAVPEIPTSHLPNAVKNKGKRCPIGSRKNKITGNCDKIRVYIERPNNVVDVVDVVDVVVKRKRCPNGTRKNKRTGNCDPK